MKRILALILAILMVVGMLVACDTDENIETEKPTEKQTESETEKPTEKQTQSESKKETEKETEKSTEDNSSNEGKNENNNENNNGNNNAVNNNNENTSNKIYIREGEKIIFGSYPQTQVTDATLVATLNSMAGTLPTSLNSQAWTSYGYYLDGVQTNFMWYIDIENNNERYRGVYFTSYRPKKTRGTVADGCEQDDNGYYNNCVYWFKFAPLSWRILTENTVDGIAFVICDMIIDAQAYQNTCKKYSWSEEDYNPADGGADVVYANNYAYSTVRQWLNDTFYNTAFSNLEKEIIATSFVVNTVDSTGYSGGAYACNNNTLDKVFLASYAEVTECFEYADGKRKTTDYAKSQGVASVPDGENAGNGWWWLRSGNANYSWHASEINSAGEIFDDCWIYTTDGIVPAIRIRVRDCDCYDDNKDHKCDVCKGVMGIHADINNDHLCEYGCSVAVTTCLDSNQNHECDICGVAVSYCTDFNQDHMCDVCGEKISVCRDSDFNCKCDFCESDIHNYQNGYCTGCCEPIYIRNENNIKFGSYPQTKVTDDTLIGTLNRMAGTLPTDENSQAWTSYGYYINHEVVNFMWYIDIEEADEKYRGVYFTVYRPDSTRVLSTSLDGSKSDYKGDSNQDDNGYRTSIVYWFKYEAISWTILSENTTNGTALILCNMIIDSQQFDYDDSYSNNYAESTIRKWLNETFYNTAFVEGQRQSILTTVVDNSATTTDSFTNQDACENTEDKIFLLSFQDVINSNYGFSSNSSTYDTARQKATTDYAQVQGAYTYSGENYDGYGSWWQRSPDGFSDSTRAFEVYVYGYTNSTKNVYCTSVGVVPALQIKL